MFPLWIIVRFHSEYLKLIQFTWTSFTFLSAASLTTGMLSTKSLNTHLLLYLLCQMVFDFNSDLLLPKGWYRCNFWNEALLCHQPRHCKQMPAKHEKPLLVLTSKHHTILPHGSWGIWSRKRGSGPEDLGSRSYWIWRSGKGLWKPKTDYIISSEGERQCLSEFVNK